MVFSSTVFMFIFLPVVLGLYFLIGEKFRNYLLLITSLFFYAWGEGSFVIVMFLSIASNYYIGILIRKNRHTTKQKSILVIALLLNLALIGFYKYANFIVNNINILFGFNVSEAIKLAPVHLPIGISFFTFQAMSYVIDIYREESDIQETFVNTALYISLFPQLIAGPIVRYKDIVEQLTNRQVNFDKFAYGIKRFSIGLGKKILIANTLAVVSNKIFSTIPVHSIDFNLSWLGIICYTIQIYFDFSGYSDMAIGLGYMFGFKFLENFNYPYISRSIKEFWTRWHISLSNWFRDYLYIPLGGNRSKPSRTYFNLVTVFFLCGLWHGASWNFVVWGLFHGIFLLLERLWIEKAVKSVWRPVSHIYTLLVVIVGWVFFRSETLSYAVYYLKALVGLKQIADNVYRVEIYLNKKLWLAIFLGIVGSTPILPFLLEWRNKLVVNAENTANVAINFVFFSLELVGICFILLFSSICMAKGTYNPFIYFNF